MDLRGKKVTVVGLGKTALSLVRLLLREGAEPYVTETKGLSSLRDYGEKLEALGVPYESGGHTDRAFKNADYVIPSPGVPPMIPAIASAVQSGAKLLGELECAGAFTAVPTLAVTGTNGKTTTTELLAALIRACGHRVVLAGNNEMPFSSAVLVDPAPEYIVLEVSSYQAELIRSFRPWMAAVLNLTPDHLARHGTIEAYGAAKARLLTNQKPGDTAVLNADDPAVRGMAKTGQAQRRWFSAAKPVECGLWLDGDRICEGDTIQAHTFDTRLRGRHNLQNVLAALAMMRGGEFDWPRTMEGLRAFPGVEHRIEPVATLDGVQYFNDSKSTNIESLRVALESFDAPVILIAGGQGKGSDYRVLRDLVSRQVKRLIAIGEDAPLLEQAFTDCVPIECAVDMEDAVARAANSSHQGDAVLLSPACASFDMFENFEHRGRVFKDCVRRLKEGSLR